MKQSQLWVLKPCLLAMLTSSAWAEEVKEEEIVVSASRSNRTATDMAQTTWIIEGNEIEQQVQGGKELKDVLAQLIPSLDISSGGRTNYGMNMRGRTMVVMVDGVRLNSSRADSRQLDAIDPFNISRVEVISGATALFGGGSTGGLVNIVTKKGSPETQVELEVGGKSGFQNHDDHDERVAAAVSGGNEKSSGRLSVAYQRFGGWYDGKGGEVLIDNTQTGLQYSDRLDVMGTGTLNIDDHQQLQLVAQYYRSKSDGEHGLYLGEDFCAVKGSCEASNSSDLDSDRIPGTERHLISLQYSNRDFLGQDLMAQLYYRDESLTFYPFPSVSSGEVTSISSSEQNTSVFGGKLTINSKPIDNLTLTYGIDADHESFDANQMFYDLETSKISGGLVNKNSYSVDRYPSYTITNVAPLLQASYDITPMFTLSGGVRYQYTRNHIDDFVGYSQAQAVSRGSASSADSIPGGTTDYGTLLYNAGILAHLTERQQLWLNFSQGVELPDPGKYYGRGSYTRVNGHYKLTNSINVDDSELEGLKTNSYELGWRYTGNNLRTQLAAYYSQSDKTITVNTTDMTINVEPDKKRIYGVEGALDYFFSDSDWSTGASFNLVKSETKNDEGKWEKYDVSEASPSKATAYVGWVPGNWTLRLQGQKTFDLSDGEGNKINGYHTLDFLSSYQLPLGRISFSIENLLDKEYTTVWGQRAQLLYSPTYGSASLYDYKGRGRTYGLNYSIVF